MKLNRKWIMVLALVMSMAMATTGTLAYLTDRDSEANVFTMGNVKIDLNEEFNQGAELIPGLDIEKEATITNTGKNDAWVWLTVLLPKEMGPYTAPDNMSASNNVVHWNYPAASADKMTVKFNSTPVEVDTDGDGVKEEYYQTNMLWNEILPVGETTGVMMNKVYMDVHVDIDPDGNMYWVDKGEVTDLNWNVNENGNPVIHVSAYAIQSEGFKTVEEAYAAYNAQWTTEEGVNNGLEYGTPATVVASADDMVEALEAGEDVILTKTITIDPASMSNAYGTTGINIKNGQTLNGNGNTIDIKGAGGTWDSGINTTGGLIKNVTVTGSFRGIFINHNSEYSERVVLENVTVDGTTYTISCDQGKNQGLTATDSTFNGWTSYAATLGEAEFINCNFGEGNGYAFCRPYAPTTFTNCNFEAGYEMDPRAAVTLDNCYLDGVLITADNLATLVTSNIANATVK